MPVTDALLYVHGTGSVVNGPITGKGTATMGDDIFTATNTTDVSNIELDLGALFPSLTERAYSNPAAPLGDGGVEFGLHLVIGAPVIGASGGMTAGTINILSDATTAATTVIASRLLTIAQLGVAGAHFFIPVDRAALKQFLRCNFVATTAAADSGTGVAWFGPRCGGEA